MWCPLPLLAAPKEATRDFGDIGGFKALSRTHTEDISKQRIDDACYKCGSNIIRCT